MLTIETKKLEISDELKRKVEMICRFACVKYTFENGNIKNIKFWYKLPYFSPLKYLILSYYCLTFEEKQSKFSKILKKCYNIHRNYLSNLHK